MSFLDYFQDIDIPSLLSAQETITKTHVRRVLNKSVWNLSDLPALLSNAASYYLEDMAYLNWLSILLCRLCTIYTFPNYY